MGIYISAEDLRKGLSPATIIALFDDDGDGEPDQAAMDLAIERAEGEVDSYLVGYYSLPLKASPIDRLVRHSAIDFAVCFAFERHPEYVRTYGEDPRSSDLYDRATKRMQRVQDAAQALPDESNVQSPANQGGGVSAMSEDPNFPGVARQFFTNMGDF